jgi:hypothetical protein
LLKISRYPSDAFLLGLLDYILYIFREVNRSYAAILFDDDFAVCSLALLLSTDARSLGRD